MIAVAKQGEQYPVLTAVRKEFSKPVKLTVRSIADPRSAESILISQLINKDVNAYNMLYNRYSKAMYGIIYRIIPCEHEASDLLQDTFVKVWQNIETYNPTKGTFFTWLLNICRNTAIDRCRSKGYRNGKKNQDIDQVTNFGGSAFEVHFNSDHIGLKALTEKLGKEYSILIDAVYFRGYTQQEISEELNIPLGTVKTRIRTALLRLRKLI